MPSESAAGLPTLGNALIFAQQLGAAGVASAIENNMFNGNEPVVLDVIHSALDSMPGTPESAYLQQVCKMDDRFEGDSRVLFHRETLAPALRLHSRTIDEVLRGFKCKDEACLPRAAQSSAPTEAEAVAFLKEAGSRGLSLGIQTAVFGAQTTDIAINVVVGALRAVAASGSAGQVYKALIDLFVSFGPEQGRPTGSNGNFDLYLKTQLLTKYELLINEAIRFDPQTAPEGQTSHRNENLYMPIAEFYPRLSARTRNVLKSIVPPLEFVGELCQMTERDLMRIPNLGRKMVKQIKEALATLGLCPGMKHEGFSRNGPKPQKTGFPRLLDV